MTRLFGTDGIRGVANEEPLTPELAYRVGRAMIMTLRHERGREQVRVVIGRDTRRSGPMLEAALVAGALSAGADCYTVGVLPTPGIAHLTRHLEADGGIVLSASHNPFEDNGIKLFSAAGIKFPDAWEDEVEALLDRVDKGPRPRGAGVGRLIDYDRAETDYVEELCRQFPIDLGGISIVLDCAHGATHRVAPRVFRHLGARVTALGARPDGLNINAGMGALHPGALQVEVRARRAMAGFAFDGDGDRLISVDEHGELRDGDHALAIAGRHLAAHGRLRENVVVTTVMANLGLDQCLREAGIRVVKTQVGDRYVHEEMQRLGANLGGEQSGHLLFLDHATTGDGILSALALLGVMRESGASLGTLAACLRKFPQVLVNVGVREKPPVDDLPGLAIRREEFEAELGDQGRILLRYSGTEALARVMIEGPDAVRIEAMAHELAELVRRAIGAG